MDGVRSEMVHIVRDFLAAHQMMRRVFSRYRSGTLRFEEVEALVGDDDRSALFRIKERCHVLFRNLAPQQGPGVRREVLFDLAVGSLFHEAMKFRENFYQSEIYAPRVESLRDEVGEDESELFDEFEKSLSGLKLRLDHALGETESLLEQTTRQFQALLASHRSNGLIARYLIEQREIVNDIFDGGIESLLADIHGELAHGYAVAARSYLDSAFFMRALAALKEAKKQYGERADLARLTHYARGMQAFLDGDFEASLSLLEQWLDAEPDSTEREFATLAAATLPRLGNLVEPSERGKLVRKSKALLERIEGLEQRWS